MDEPKTIAGLHCFAVLERLDDYVSGELADELVDQVNRHLSGCRACADFGGRYSALVDALHRDLKATGGSDGDARAVAEHVLRVRGY